MRKKAVPGDWQGRKPKTKQAMLEDALELSTVVMALGFLFSLWGVEVSIREW